MFIQNICCQSAAGNILIWALTNVNNNTKYELAIDMEDWSDNRRFARYRSFRLGSERDAFRLYHQNLYYGNAGDSLYSHNGMPFSTFDVDNDNRDGNFEESSCARLYKVSFSCLCLHKFWRAFHSQCYRIIWRVFVQKSQNTTFLLY